MKSLKQILSAVETLEMEGVDAEDAWVDAVENGEDEETIKTLETQFLMIQAAAQTMQWVADTPETRFHHTLIAELLGESCNEVPRDTSPSEN